MTWTRSATAPVAWTRSGDPGTCPIIVHVLTQFSLKSPPVPSGQHISPATAGAEVAPAPVLVRSYAPDDFEAVCALYPQVFGASALGPFKARWDWSERGTVAGSTTPRWVLQAGDAIVGFLAAVAMDYQAGNERVVAHTPCDFMVRPDHRFHGVKLMREFFRSGRNCVSWDDIAATIKVTTWLGAPRAATLDRWTKPLDARAFARRGALTRVPAALWWPVTRGMRAAEALSSIRRRHEARVEIEVVKSFDARFDRLFERRVVPGGASVLRDSRFLNWRYGPASPHEASETAVVADGAGELLGYVISHASTGDRRRGYIMDLQAAPGADDAVAGALLAHAVARLRKLGPWTVSHYQVAGERAISEPLLRRHGFVKRRGLELLVRMRGANGETPAEPQRAWSGVFGDTEASFSAV